MSTELQVPFALNAAGGIAAVTDPNTQAQQHVDSLISTTPGERAMQPTYGVDLTGQIFRPDTAELAADVQVDIQQAFADWEPSIQLNSVTPVEAQSGDPVNGIVTLDVDWFIPGQTAATTKTGVTQATLLPGGTVVTDQQVLT